MNIVSPSCFAEGMYSDYASGRECQESGGKADWEAAARVACLCDAV